MPRTKDRSIIEPTIQIQNWPASSQRARARAITMEIKNSPNNLRALLQQCVPEEIRKVGTKSLVSSRLYTIVLDFAFCRVFRRAVSAASLISQEPYSEEYCSACNARRRVRQYRISAAEGTRIFLMLTRPLTDISMRAVH